MKSKLKFIVPLVLIASLGGYKFGFAEEPPKGPEPKVHGEVYVLGKDFLINLRNGGFAKLGVALIVEPGTAAPAAAGGHGAAPAEPPQGYGTLPQEALVRDIVTDALTNAEKADLVSRRAREKLKKRIVAVIKKKSDVHIEDVLLTDLAVQ